MSHLRAAVLFMFGLALASQAEPLRVASYNIRYGTASDGPNHWTLRRAKVVEALRKESADLIGLQEALRFQLDEVRAALPGFREIGRARDDGQAGGEYSCLLVSTSRFSVVESRTEWLSDTPTVPGSTSWGNKLPRICTYALLEDLRDGQAVHAFNTHLDHQSAASRLRSAEFLANRIRLLPSGARVILTGDFNTGPDSPPLRTLLASREANGAGLLDAVAVASPDLATRGTFHNWSDRLDGPRIDFILVQPPTRILSAHVRDDAGPPYASDHRLIAAEMEWR